MKIPYYTLLLVILTLPACAWIELTEEGSEVILVKAGNVTNCQKLGITNVTVTHKIGALTRDEDVVTEELIIAGKNSAVKLGGDSIVAKGENIEGKMSFDVYKCNK